MRRDQVDPSQTPVILVRGLLRELVLIPIARLDGMREEVLRPMRLAHLDALLGLLECERPVLRDTLHGLRSRSRKTRTPAQERANERKPVTKAEDAAAIVGTEKERDPVVWLGVTDRVEWLSECKLA